MANTAKLFHFVSPSLLSSRSAHLISYLLRKQCVFIPLSEKVEAILPVQTYLARRYPLPPQWKVSVKQHKNGPSIVWVLGTKLFFFAAWLKSPSLSHTGGWVKSALLPIHSLCVYFPSWHLVLRTKAACLQQSITCPSASHAQVEDLLLYLKQQGKGRGRETPGLQLYV